MNFIKVLCYRFSLLLICNVFFYRVALPDQLTDRIARQILVLSNQERQQHGCEPLSWDQGLALAATIHCQDMCEKDFFDHSSPVPGRATVEERLEQVGVVADNCSENIFWCSGYADEKIPALALAEWLHSVGHRQNLLDKYSRNVGVGVYRSKRAYWVTEVFNR